MNIYFREFDPSSPATTGAQWLSALAARIALAMFVYSVPHLDVGQRLIVSARQAWVLCVLLAAWFAISIIPATAGLADVVNALLLAIGALELMDRAKEIGSAALECAHRAKWTANSGVIGPRIPVELDRGFRPNWTADSGQLDRTHP